MSDNTGYLFYKEYYKGIDIRQFSGREQKKIKEKNSILFEKKNKVILRNTPSPEDLALLNIWKEVEHVYSLSFQTDYPGLIIGSGYIHETGSEGEFKLGCFFDHTTGWPTIPGSSVKGMLRSYFPNFEKQDGDFLKPLLQKASEKQLNKAKYIWYLLHDNSLEGFDDSTSYETIYKLEKSLFDNWDVINTADSEQFLSLDKRLVFFDAVLAEENTNNPILADDAITPHSGDALKNPIPLIFMRIAPNVKFNFYFKLPQALFKDLDFTKDQVLELFNLLLSTHGIGAKTNVGYGKLIAPAKPVVFEKGQSVEGELIYKEQSGNLADLSFQIEGNPQPAIARVKKAIYYDYEKGDKLNLIVSSVTGDGIIKYVKLA